LSIGERWFLREGGKEGGGKEGGGKEGGGKEGGGRDGTLTMTQAGMLDRFDRHKLVSCLLIQGEDNPDRKV
jgi:hypothetical protein